MCASTLSNNIACANAYFGIIICICVSDRTAHAYEDREKTERDR